MGKFGVDLSGIDLSKLIGGKHLTIPCTLSKNGYGIQLHTLGDTGANGFAFLNTPLAYDIAKFFDIKAKRLPFSVAVKGFNGEGSTSVSHYLQMHFTIDGRKQYNCPLLILDLGSHDMIIGRAWFEHFRVLLNIHDRKLLWPKDLPASYSVAKEILVSKESIGPQNPQLDY